jgi:hypothetical protein
MNHFGDIVHHRSLPHVAEEKPEDPVKLIPIPGQLLRMCEPTRDVICDSRRKENPRPSPPPATVVQQRSL